MDHDADQPWWLQGAPDDDATGADSSIYDSAPIPPPPPPPMRPTDDSAWLRDAPGDSFAPAGPPHPPPGVTVSNGWSQSFPRTPAPPPPPPAARPSAASRRPAPSSSANPPAPVQRHSNAGVRILLVIFLALLATTIGVTLKRYDPSLTPSGLTLPGLGSPPTPTGYAQSALITFTRTTKTVAAPSSTIVAATDGSGQVKATQQTASVTGAATGAIQATYQIASNVIFPLTVINNSPNPILSGGSLIVTSNDGKVTCGLEGSVTVPAHGNAQQKCDEPIKTEPAASWDYTDPSTGLNYTGDSPAGGNAAYYYVPSNCGDPSAAESAVRTALQGQLALPAGSALLFGPTYTFDTHSLACTPAAGTQQGNSFTYVQKINATASQTIYAQADVQAYQLAQVKAKIPAGYELVSSQICPNGPLVGNGATATRATITCPATALAGWTWTPAALTALATAITTADPGTAKIQLNQTPGIVAGSVTIALTNGSELPQNPGVITFKVTP